MKKIVGISGQLGSGKDTAADRLINEFGFVKVALADPIKRYGMQVFNFTEEQLWGSSNHRNAWDSRFHHYVGPYDGDDAWMASFRRAEHYDKEYCRVLFRDLPLKQVSVHQSLKDWHLWLAKEHTRLSPRVMLQSLGTEWGRKIQSDLWIKYAVDVSETLLGGGYVYDRAAGLISSDASTSPPGVVISDIRFKNELAIIKQAHGFLIRIKRPDTDNQAAETGIQGHASEQEQQTFKDADFNYVISNDGSLHEFIEDIDVAGIILTGGNR